MEIRKNKIRDGIKEMDEVFKKNEMTMEEIGIITKSAYIVTRVKRAKEMLEETAEDEIEKLSQTKAEKMKQEISRLMPAIISIAAIAMATASIFASVLK